MFENLYFHCTYSIKINIFNVQGLGLSEKCKNQFPARKTSLSWMQKLVPAKHQKSLICKNKLQQKSLATWYSVNYHSNFCWSFIKAVSLFLEWRWPEFIEPHPCVSTHDSGMWRLFTRHTSMLSISRRQTRKGFIPKILMGMKWSYSLCLAFVLLECHWNPI